MKKSTEQENLKEGAKKPTAFKAEELKTDFPLSEKDEVKQAEANMRQRRKRIL